MTETNDDTEDFLKPLQRFPGMIEEWRAAAEAYAKMGANLVQRRAEIIALGGQLGLPKMKIGRSLPLALLERDKSDTGEPADAPTDAPTDPSAAPRSELDKDDDLDIPPHLRRTKSIDG